MDIERLARLALFSSDAYRKHLRLTTPQGNCTQNNSSDLPPFQYPLLGPETGSFRLLRVLPGKKHEPIRCELTEDLDTKPSYIALSYLWDRVDTNVHLLVCNGAILKVQPNLWAFFLRYRARKADEGTKLWVDALCIHQSNVVERNKQVAHMRDIYSSASSVIV